MREIAASSGGSFEQVHPLDVVEQAILAQGWNCDRDEDSVSTIWKGVHAEYNLNFKWMEDISVLHFACVIEQKIPAPRLKEIRELVRLLNEEMWHGHFDIWPHEDSILFRYGHLLGSGAYLTDDHCFAMIKGGISAWDYFYQAFQFVIWAGKSASDAIELVKFETVGEA